MRYILAREWLWLLGTVAVTAVLTANPAGAGWLGGSLLGVFVVYPVVLGLRLTIWALHTVMPPRASTSTERPAPVNSALSSRTTTPYWDQLPGGRS